MEILKLEHVNKKFCKKLHYSLLYGFLDVFSYKVNTSLRKHEMWGLHDVNIRINTGDYVGILGTNGSGKTTLVRIITGIYRQNSGNVTLNGKVLALFIGNLALNRFYSGVENYYIMGTLLGFSKKQLDEKIDIVKNFSELGDDIYNPMGTYSSGMKVRLRFGYVKALMPDLLIIDEALSVSDMHFQKKCSDFLDEFSKERAVVMISHDLSLIKNTCNRIIILDNGVVKTDTTDVANAIAIYEQK